MTTRSELELENSRLKSQIDLLTLEINSLVAEKERNLQTIEDANAIVAVAEPSVYRQEHFKEFTESLDFVKPEEFFKDKILNNFSSNTMSFSFEGNNILFKGKQIANISDDRYIPFIKKMTEVFPWLLRAYVQYAKYHQLIYNIKEYNFFKDREKKIKE
jgi:hypothetical protein